MGQTPEPLIIFTYGWGRICRLYRDHLDIDDTIYPLAELVHVRPRYHRVMGVTSARLTLRFREEDVVLRGIAAINEVHQAVTYLTMRCDANLAPRRKMEKVSLPAISADTQQPSLLQRQYSNNSDTPGIQMVAQTPQIAQQVTQTTTKPVAVLSSSSTLKQHARARRREQLEKLRSIRIYGFDVDKLARKLQAETLPPIPVPLHLVSGERAYYSTDATLCSKATRESESSHFILKDCGTLILTNRRMLYLGRKSQLIVDYTRLAQVFRLQQGIALTTLDSALYSIFELPRPLECTMYLETLLQKYQSHAYQRLQQQHAPREAGRSTTNATPPLLTTSPMPKRISVSHASSLLYDTDAHSGANARRAIDEIETLPLVNTTSRQFVRERIQVEEKI